MILTNYTSRAHQYLQGILEGKFKLFAFSYSPELEKLGICWRNLSNKPSLQTSPLITETPKPRVFRKGIKDNVITKTKDFAFLEEWVAKAKKSRQVEAFEWHQVFLCIALFRAYQTISRYVLPNDLHMPLALESVLLRYVFAHSRNNLSEEQECVPPPSESPCQ